jgi:amino acid efflux transporter
MLSTRTGIALYVGAVLGPGVLFLPAAAARAAGPASVLAWVGLLAMSVPLALTFAALGVRQPEAGGTAAYARAAFGARAGAATGWWFEGGVMIGAPAVALIGGFYVAELLGTGRAGAVVAAAAMMAMVMAVNVAGLRVTARLQLWLAGLLAALLLVAVVSALPESRASNWTPFAPHGWAAIGDAASLLMLSFVGWEAVSHLAGELRDPARQLPRAIFAALGVVIVLYLGLAVATVGVLGTAAPSDVPLADLMGAGLGGPGRTVTAALAVLLTMGTMNTYVAAAVKLAGALAEEGAAPAAFARPTTALACLAAVATVLLVPLAADVISADTLVRACSACFVAVYVLATAAGVRLLDGRARWAAGSGLAAVLVVLAFSGPYMLVPVAIALLASARPARRLVSA